VTQNRNKTMLGLPRQSAPTPDYSLLEEPLELTRRKSYRCAVMIPPPRTGPMPKRLPYVAPIMPRIDPFPPMIAALVVIALTAFMLLATGCGYQPPQSIRLDPTFTPVQVAVIEDALDQWCAADGWCPFLSNDGEVPILKTPDQFVEHGREYEAARTYSDPSRIIVSGYLADLDPEMLWIVVAHELGHLHGVAHHGGPECTMFGRHSAPSTTLACEP
jgi:hypothetical protein